MTITDKPNVCVESVAAGIYVTKTVKKCLQFVYIFADLLPVQFQTKFLILAVKCLTNCLLQQFFSG
jgi:hypothetical protein